MSDNARRADEKRTTILHAGHSDLHGVVASKLAIGTPFFLVGRLFLEHQSDPMPMKRRSS
jgi:hypothetical protein